MTDLTPSTTSRKRILVAEPIAEEGLAILRTDHDVEVRTGLERSEFLRILPEYDALLVAAVGFDMAGRCSSTVWVSPREFP